MTPFTLPAGRAAFAFTVALALLLGCRSVLVRPGGDPEASALDRHMSGKARELIGQLPAGSRLVVANFARLGTANNSVLGVYLAKYLTAALYREARGRITIINRPAGEQAATEELLYTVGRKDYKGLLDHFRADYAVLGTYDLRPDGCILELVELTVVSTTGAEQPYAGQCLVQAGASDFDYWQKLEAQVLPVAVSPKLARFVAETGGWDVLSSCRIVLASGTELPGNGNVRVGASYRARFRASAPCFVYCLGWDQTNSVLTVLYPGPKESAAFSPGEHDLPPQGFIRADPPAGYNVLRLVATSKDLGLLSTGTLQLTDLGVQSAIVDSVQALGTGGWGAASVGYYISDK